MISLILSGGVGTRLWPLSREKLPKQFAPLLADSLFTLSVRRLSQLGEVQVCTSEKLRTLTENSIRKDQLEITQAYYEPQARNTAPAIALVCHDLMMKGKLDEVLGVYPSDHWIEDEASFRAAIDLAEQCAEEGKIVTIGIKPTYPATGFGYISRESQPYKTCGALSAHEVLGFKEKPNLQTAQAYLGDPTYCWNSGMFVFKVRTMVQCFEKFMPELWQGMSHLKEDLSNLAEVYSGLASQSIDYGIMEHAPGQVNIACDFGWSDLGSWDDIAAIADRRSIESSAKNLSVKASNCFGHSQKKKLMCFLEVDDLIVVDTDDALLITRKNKTQSVKNLVDQLREVEPAALVDHTFEHRPWGSYFNLAEEEKFKTKIIIVDPGQQLSYQSHEKRSEVWITVEGEGEVVLSDEIIPVQPGKVVTIPVGAKHRMRNPHSRPLKFVEVQLGSYFGEDDIVRYHDDYKRV